MIAHLHVVPDEPTVETRLRRLEGAANKVCGVLGYLIDNDPDLSDLHRTLLRQSVSDLEAGLR